MFFPANLSTNTDNNSTGGQARKLIFLLAIAFALSTSAGLYDQTSVNASNKASYLPGPPRITLGSPEFIPFANENIPFSPDGHVSFVRTKYGYSVFFPGHGCGWIATGPSFDSLSVYKSNSNPVPVLVPGTNPDPNSYNYDYDGINSIIQLPSGQLMCFTESENHPNRPLTTPQIHSIAVAFSNDGGYSWFGEHQSISIPAQNAGLPCARLVEPWESKGEQTDLDGIYCYYTVPAKNSTYLAIERLSALGDPMQWKSLGPVLPGVRGHITYNPAIKKFLAVFADFKTHEYYIAASRDGIRFGAAQDLGFSSKAVAYPSLISPDQPSSSFSSRFGYLYYADYITSKPPHYCFRRSFILDDNDHDK